MAEAQTVGAMTLKQQREAMRDGRLIGVECAQCRARSIVPFTRCSKCGGTDVRWVPFATEGTVVTYTIQVVAPEQFINEVPFAWVLVELDGGPVVSGWIPFISKPDELKTGQRVRFTPSYKPGTMFEKV